LPALDAKIVVFPAAELPRKPSPSLHVLESPPPDTAAGAFRGGGLRGLFWAVVLEVGILLAATGAVLALDVLRH
jgi:hypothetical protein